MKSIGVIQFAGTNCDRDVFQAVWCAGLKPAWLWHKNQFNPGDFEALILPGGFSFGDYLRTGALAAQSPVMDSVREAAKLGVPILGICNGFQILCESHLLPGALVQNESRRFIDRWEELIVENTSKNFASRWEKGRIVRMPIAHGDGRYYAPADDLKKLEDEGLVWLRYAANPNGSLNNIAGIMNKNKNIYGLMPHPERATQSWHGCNDGMSFFTALRPLV